MGLGVDNNDGGGGGDVWEMIICHCPHGNPRQTNSDSWGWALLDQFHRIAPHLMIAHKKSPLGVDTSWIWLICRRNRNYLLIVVWHCAFVILLELQLAVFVVLAMILRRKPDVLISQLRKWRDDPDYGVKYKFPVYVWVICQVCNLPWQTILLLYFPFLLEFNEFCMCRLLKEIWMLGCIHGHGSCYLLSVENHTLIYPIRTWPCSW